METTKKVTIRYKCRDIGYGVEHGVVCGYLTNEVDRWGKRTILAQRANGRFEAIYLFPDEWKIVRQED